MPWNTRCRRRRLDFHPENGACAADLDELGKIPAWANAGPLERPPPKSPRKSPKTRPISRPKSSDLCNACSCVPMSLAHHNLQTCSFGRDRVLSGAPAPSEHRSPRRQCGPACYERETPPHHEIQTYQNTRSCKLYCCLSWASSGRQAVSSSSVMNHMLSRLPKRRKPPHDRPNKHRIPSKRGAPERVLVRTPAVRTPSGETTTCERVKCSTFWLVSCLRMSDA